MALSYGSRFWVCGTLERASVWRSGKGAFLTIVVPGKRRLAKYEVKVYGEHVEKVKALVRGELVRLLGSLEHEALQDRNRTPVVVDGRPHWVLALKVEEIVTDSDLQAARESAPAPAIPGAPTPRLSTTEIVDPFAGPDPFAGDPPY